MSAAMDTEEWDDDATNEADWGDDQDNNDDGWGASDDDGAWESTDTKMDATKSPPELTRQQSYDVLDQDELEKRKQDLIQSTSDLLFVNAEEADCLLRHYGWKNTKLQQDWFADQAKVRKQVGLVGRQTYDDPKPDENIHCHSAFCDVVPANRAFALNCGHFFCLDCWKGFLTSQITTGRSCVFTTCMGFRCQENHRHGFGCACDEMVPASVYERFIDDTELIQKYHRWVLDSFVEGQRRIKWCPDPRCNRAVEYQSGGTKDVSCSCGYMFCFACGEQAHVPAPCDIVGKWLEKDKSDDATQIWLAARTKECPKCTVRIEKNKACNHMKCAKCGHDFCWLCKGPWSKHGSSTGGYYVCNKYNDDVSKGDLSSEEQKIRENQLLLQKYTFYYKRFKDSEAAIKYTRERWTSIERIVSERELDYAKVSFLSEASRKLEESRRVLQWTYAMAYYLRSGKEKELFEFQQALLAQQTEELQECMETTDIEVLQSKRRRIIDLTGSIDKFRRKMVEHVESGDFEALLLTEADAAMHQWACTVCKWENKPDVEFCANSGCAACRKHGEQDCKACKKQ